MNPASSNPVITLPKRAYAVAMTAVTLAAIGCTALLATALGGDANTILLAAAALAVASVATFLPIIFSFRLNPQNFGLAILGASMLRMLIVMAIGLGFDYTHSLVKSPFWIGLMSGAGLLLAVESALAITILSRIERQKAAHQAATSETR